MILGKVLFIAGLLVAVAYLITIMVVTLRECTGASHPSEDTVAHVFTKIAIIYGVIVAIYLIGHYAGVQNVSR